MISEGQMGLQKEGEKKQNILACVYIGEKISNLVVIIPTCVYIGKVFKNILLRNCCNKKFKFT
jgi:hypothetical protein